MLLYLLFIQLHFEEIFKKNQNIFILLCGYRFPSGILFLLPEGFPLTFLVLQVYWWWILSTFLCLVEFLFFCLFVCGLIYFDINPYCFDCLLMCKMENDDAGESKITVVTHSVSRGERAWSRQKAWLQIQSWRFICGNKRKRLNRCLLMWVEWFINGSNKWGLNPRSAIKSWVIFSKLFKCFEFQFSYPYN